MFSDALTYNTIPLAVSINNGDIAVPVAIEMLLPILLVILSLKLPNAFTARNKHSMNNMIDKRIRKQPFYYVAM